MLMEDFPDSIERYWRARRPATKVLPDEKGVWKDHRIRHLDVDIAMEGAL